MRGRHPVVAAALVVATATIVLTGCADVNPTGALSRMAHLDEGVPVADHIVPPVVPGVDADLVDTSVRLLAEQDGTAFWVGATTSDDVCFIAAPAPADLPTIPVQSSSQSQSQSPSQSPSQAPASATGAASAGFGPSTSGTVELPVPSLAVDAPEAVCLSPESFGSHGATLHLGAEGTRVWLHTEYMAVTSGWVPIAQNIAVRA